MTCFTPAASSLDSFATQSSAVPISELALRSDGPWRGLTNSARIDTRHTPVTPRSG